MTAAKRSGAGDVGVGGAAAHGEPEAAHVSDGKIMSLVASMFLLEFGTAATLVAIPLLVIEHHGLGLEVGITIGLSLLPSVFLGVFVGNIVDRHDPRKVAMLSAGSGAVVVPLFAATGALWQVQLLALLMGVSYMFGVPALMALRPHVISPGSEMRGNSLVVTAQRSARLLGPMCAGAIIAIAGLPWVFALEAGTGLTAAALLACLSLRPSPAAHASANDGSERAPLANGLAAAGASPRRMWALFGGFAAIVALVRHDRKLAALTAAALIYMVGFGLGGMFLASYSLEAFHHTPGMLGYLLGALGAGGAAGALLAQRLGERPSGLVFVLSTVGEALCWVLLPVVPGTVPVIGLLLAAGVLESTAAVFYFAEVQRRSAGFSGRYYALVIPLSDTNLFIGRALGGVVTDHARPQLTAAIIGLIMAAPVLVLLAPLSRRGADDQTEHRNLRGSGV